LEGRPEAKNLVGIYAEITDESVERVLERFAGQGFGAFKPALADALIALLSPLRARLDEFRKDPAELDRILDAGAARAGELGAPVLAGAYRAVGLK
jgi:tryptophanyl-tRNA synthetase